MIEIQNLNDVSVEDILEEAKKNILYQSALWTNFQESDPGITLVELFSWLKYVQHEYLNRISPGVKMKFLKLLDVSLRRNKGSETLLKVSGIKEDVRLPVRTQWKSKNMVFENLYSHKLIKSGILSVMFENPETPCEAEYYKFDGKKSFFLFGKDTSRKNNKNSIRRFTINFDSPLPTASVMNLYFSVYSGEGITRNAIKSSDKFENMAKVKWEYYGKENGICGWHDIEIEKDDTHNFLFSGIVRMKLGGESICESGEYKIRATLESDEYDYPPRVNNILVNVFKAVQNETHCENTIIKKEDISVDHKAKIQSHTALYGDSEIYFKKHGGWVKTSVPKVTPNIESSEVFIDVSNIWQELKNFAHDEEVLMVVSYEKRMKKKITLGSATGISSQVIPFNLKNILADGLEIMVAEKINGEDVFFKWKSVDNFFSSLKTDRHYIADVKNDAIIFGDHEHAVAPRPGVNNIKICSLRKTFGAQSNTKEDMVKSVVSKNKIIKNCAVMQITPAIGGADFETLEHAQARAANIFDNPQRAVTVADYERIVKSTPGLMFTNVKILPGYMPGEDVQKQNCVTVAVRWNNKIGLTLPKSFEKNILNHLEKYRLINTKIKVVSPEYIGLIIGGTLTVDPSYREKSGLIEEGIKKFIYGVNSEMGKTLYYGDLFGTIDRLEYVCGLNNLSITALGNGMQKNVSDDIIIPPNGVYYIKKIDFNYIRSSEIYIS